MLIHLLNCKERLTKPEKPSWITRHKGDMRKPDNAANHRRHKAELLSVRELPVYSIHQYASPIRRATGQVGSLDFLIFYQ